MTIVNNQKARFDYFIEERYEAGLVLEGWEVKAIVAGKVQLGEAYAVLRDGAFWLLNAHVSPLITASTHTVHNPTRTRKLLLNKSELNALIGKIEQRGYTLVPLNMHFKNGKIKLEVALAKGKLKADKRDVQKDRDWKREKDRLMKSNR